jgi:hypothetical protein
VTSPPPPYIDKLPPLIDNLLTPDSSITNNELEAHTTLPPASPVLPAAEPAPASPILIDSTTGEPPVHGSDSPNSAWGLGSPRSTSQSPINYIGPNVHPQHCSSIPHPKLAELGIFCTGVHQYRAQHGTTPPALEHSGVFYDINPVGMLQYI